MTVTAIQPLELSPVNSIPEWEDFFLEGEGYLKTAFGAFEKRQNVFTPDILYNIVAMAIEKFIMAALMYHNTLPFNHTMTDLVQAMETTCPNAIEDLREELLKLDTYQEICDIDTFTIQSPTMAEIPKMIDVADKLRFLIASTIFKENEQPSDKDTVCSSN